MTADELLAEAAENRIERKYVDIREALYLVLGIVLETIDYENEKATLPAQIARVVATCIASIDDNPKCAMN